MSTDITGRESRVAAGTNDFGELWVWVIAGLVALLHLAVAARYDFFRNELYFIACGRHPGFGYVDQPPLVPLIAAATQLFGNNLLLLRLPAVLAATALVPVTASIANVLGGTRGAKVIAALAAAIAPGLMALTSNLGTATLEPLGWTLCAYLVLRAVVRGDTRAFLWTGFIAGLSLEAKYGIAIWLVGLTLGVLITNARRVLFSRNFLLGAVIAVAIGLPSLIWQSLYGWPFLAIIARHSNEGRFFAGSPVGFTITQALAMNIVLAPLWIVGLIAPFVSISLKPARVLAVAFVLTGVAVMAAHGKDYYLFPAFPAVFAVGAVAAGRWSKWLNWPWMVLALANSLLILPLMLPVLSPDRLHDYIVRHHLAPRPNEAAGIGASITQVFSDEFPWRALEAKVASIYAALPEADRSHAGIFASNYGEAGAIDFFGRADNLPPALSGQNQYFLWGPRGYDGQVLIVINGDPERWKRLCTRLEIAGTFGAPYAMPYEESRPIMICRGLVKPLGEMWPMFQRYY
jgi:4-amino-4-deoxy-L-arabinose transferase-like glycosyltransferase